MSNENSLDQKLSIDTDDRKILSLLKENPEYTHVEIAETINKSQPAVGARILKLERKGLLTKQYGINLRENKFVMLIVSMYSRKPAQLLETLAVCPFVVNAFKTSGKQNITVLMIGTRLERLETIIERHFRTSPDISRLSVNVVTEPIDQLILPVNFFFEVNNDKICSPECHESILKLVKEGNDYEPVMMDSEVNQLFKIDDDDKRIIMYLQQEPTITHTEIGKRINKSQPAVGARIAKLKKRNFLGLYWGVNFKRVDEFHLMQVSVSAQDSAKIIERVKRCPFLVMGFRTIGDASLVLMFAGYSLEKIDNIIDYVLRYDEQVNDLDAKIILKYSHDLILPYNFDWGQLEDIPCNECNMCRRELPADLMSSLKNAKN